MRIPSELTVRKNRLLMTFLTLCSFFMAENTFSLNHWDREFVQVKYVPKDHSIEINFLFYDYCFGPIGEHGYPEILDFSYSLNALHSYQRLVICEVEEQVQSNFSWLIMRDKLLGAKLQFIGFFRPHDTEIWDENTTKRIQVKNYHNRAYLKIRWLIPDNLKIKNIMVTGVWHVKGLYCSYKIDGDVYEISYPKTLKRGVNTNLIYNNDVNASGIDHAENNELRLYTEADAVVLKGANVGENIQVYTISGVQVKSINITNDIMIIKLPAKQLYFINIGKVRFKVAL